MPLCSLRLWLRMCAVACVALTWYGCGKGVEVGEGPGVVTVNEHTCMHDEVQRRLLQQPPLAAAELGAGGNNGSLWYWLAPLSRAAETVGAQAAGEVGARAAEPAETYMTTVVQQEYDLGASTWSPIRIGYSKAALYDSSKYCTSASGRSPDFRGNTVACSAVNVFTAEKRALLVDTVLPAVASMLSGALRVNPVVGNIRVPGSNPCGDQYPSPGTDSNPGVSNVDYVTYITAGPTSGSTIAWAGFAAVDSNGRPLIGCANFSPEYLISDNAPEQRTVIRVGVHEMLHALGFSYTFFTSMYFKTKNVIKTGTRRGGQPVTLYAGANALAKAREFYACPTLDGIELEDEGGAGTAMSHWERRDHYEAMMAGIVGSVMSLSSQTLGMLEDSGHYMPDYSKAEPMRWGMSAGCGLSSEKPNTVAGGSGTLFCFDTSGSSMCTYDRLAIGRCFVGTLGQIPSWAQFFPGTNYVGAVPLMDYAPIVAPYSNRVCSDGSQKSNEIEGSYFGSGGKCLVTSDGLIKKGYSYGGTTPGPARCMKVRCSNNRVGFQIGNNPTWINCPADGSEAQLDMGQYGYTGTVTCGKASILCFDYPPIPSPTTSGAASLFGTNVLAQLLAIAAVLLCAHVAARA